jgi:alkanesulfonate monooxygenase SsuD/methylene tetrahydromethanopterin reductase-like flavin-dependent oxidoreductase (luciferase family)
VDIAIGLPALRPDPALSITVWARGAEERGFTSLGIIDRLVYDNYEPLTALAVAAGATSHIRLTTCVLVAPLRANGALLAKSAATLDRLSRGRLVLGVAPGPREDDYRVGGVDFRHRGKLLDAFVEQAVRQWDGGDGVGPAPATPGGPPLLFGGTSEATLRRIAARGIGWIGGASGVADFRAFAPRARQAWSDAERAGAPRLVATANFALGPDAEPRLRRSILDYYAFATGPYAERSLAAGLTSPQQVAREIMAYAEAGCDELILLPNGGGVEQLDLVADAAGL